MNLLIFISSFICFGIPKPHSRRFRLAAGVLFLENMPCLRITISVQSYSIFVNNSLFYLFGKTPNRRGTQFHVDKWSNFVLSSHLDPIGDQKYFPIIGNILCIFAISGRYCGRGGNIGNSHAGVGYLGLSGNV